MTYFFLEYTDACNFADDSAFHAYDKELNSLINKEFTCEKVVRKQQHKITSR